MPMDFRVQGTVSDLCPERRTPQMYSVKSALELALSFWIPPYMPPRCGLREP